jgi:hypothetical protein
MSEGHPWVDRIMLELPVHLPASEYNAIYSAVAAIGEQAGKRLVHAIGVAVERGQRETKLR